MAHFKIENLTFSYPNSGKSVLNGINLEIQRGEYIAICGKSGSGKTTLMNHLKTVLTPFGKRSGEIYFDGKPLSEVDERTQSAKIGFVMQNPDSQIVTDKVWHELAFGLESLGCDQRTMRLRVAEMANYFGIEGWFHKKVSELSGGQKQLLNLASIMAMQPSVLILDEPTSQLDPIAAADFLATVRKINLELGTTVIISEHRLEEVFPSSDRVVFIENGTVAAVDEPRNFGVRLKEMNSDMLHALPSSVRIHSASGSKLTTPLTVREGRNWLSEELGDIEVLSATKIKIDDASEVAFDDDPDEPAVEIREAWFRYEKDAADVLKGTSLKVAPNTLYAVVGGNGTGKSTTLKAICGIVKPYRGKVYVDGKHVDKYKSSELFHGCLAMLPQDPVSLFVKKTVKEELLEMVNNETAIQAIAEKCEITHLMDAHPYDLSGGEQQRVALAKVLLCQPKILLLDEPTKGIDSFFKIKLAKILDDLKKDGITIIMVSHDVEFCAKYADSVSMFFDGSIITSNTPRKFFSQNSFYTTAANRMSRHIFENAVTDEDVVVLYRANKQEAN